MLGIHRAHWWMVFLAAAFWCCAARAQTRVHFDLPAQPLARALEAIGTASHVDIGFSSRRVEGLTAPALKADLTVDDALLRVLSGTGLRAQRLNDHAIVIAAAESTTAIPAERKLSLAASAPQGTQEPGVPQMPETADSASASDQESKTSLDEIVVTGSHILGIENKTNPVIVIDRTQIEQSGYASTQDLLTSLPQNYAGGNTTQAGFIGSGQLNGDFSSAINLRGLGASSTLVLLNGHRMAPGVQGTQVDVSSIPIAAIERIEILTDGASAIYGSDAVGGVVNIITKKDYDGAETAARFGSVTSGSRHEETIAQTAGKSWSTGNMTGTFQYQGHSRLESQDRVFSEDVQRPTDLLPAEHTYSSMLSGRQRLADSVEVYADMLWSKRLFDENESNNFGAGIGDSHSKDYGSASNLNIASGVSWDFLPKWSLQVNGLFARQDTRQAEPETGPAILTFFAVPVYDITQTSSFDEKSIELLVNGKVAQTGAGDVGVAIGGSYRDENAAVIADIQGAESGHADLDRTVRSYYAETYVPLVAERNAIPLVQALALSAAVRGDRYSDFGSTTNPRIGLSWSPVSRLSLRASYGTSFRAPTEYEISQTIDPQIGIIPLQNPAGAGTVPVIESSVVPPLTAERSSNIDVGLQYKPAEVAGDLTLNYYDIRYKDRIIEVNPPANALIARNVYGPLITSFPSDAAAQAYLDDALAAGATYFGNYAGTTGTNGVRYAFDVGILNASIVRQSGFDLTGNLTNRYSSGALRTTVNATFVDKIRTAYSPGASFTNLVGTYGNPPKWRGRLLEAWTTEGWEVNGALSVVGGYLNTAGLGSPPVASWTTVDLGARVHLDRYLSGFPWRRLTVGLSVLNVLNRNPPYLDATSLTSEPIHYDPTNASPLGRFVSIDLRKSW